MADDLWAGARVPTTLAVRAKPEDPLLRRLRQKASKADWRGATAVPQYRDTPTHRRAREAPSLGDYAAVVGQSLTGAPAGTVDLTTEVLPALGSAAYDYLRTSTPEEVLSDTGGALRSYGQHWAHNPMGAAADLLPIVGDVKAYTDLVGEAARLRKAGDEESAARLAGLALPTAAIGLLPDLGGAALLRRGASRAVTEGLDDVAKAAVRPTYSSIEEGPFLNVRREGAEPLRMPGAREANLTQSRKLLANPATNQPFQVANEYATRELGTPYDLNFPDPGTSLQKQSGIGAAFRTAHEASPEYKSALFERYGEMMPDVVEKSGAQNYDQLTEAAYRQLADETSRQFDVLPVNMRYHYGEGEYPTPSAMLQDVLGQGNLNVFRGGDPHPYLSDIDPATGLTANEMFRAVHDYFGHGTRGTTFRPGGEEMAYASHAQMMSPLARMALLSETRGQNSLVNYSPLNADLTLQMRSLRDQIDKMTDLDAMRGQPGKSAPEIRDLNAQLRELGAQTQFAPQEPLLLPPEYLDPMTQGGVPDWLQPLIRSRAGTGPERAVHLSGIEGLRATDPAFFGTGHRGRDFGRMGDKGSPRQHTSFYLGPQGTVVPEKVVADVSPYAYETTLRNLYDIGEDPEGLVKLARAYNLKQARMGNEAAHIPDLTRLVKEYGYSGYRNPAFTGNQAAANVFGPVEDLVPITRGEKGFAEGGFVSALGAVQED